jgi:hypothetical protein
LSGSHAAASGPSGTSSGKTAYPGCALSSIKAVDSAQSIAAGCAAFAFFLHQ